MFEAAGTTAAETIGKIIIATGEAFLKDMPDALLILGDTNSSLAAISAKRLKILFFIWKLVTGVLIYGYRKK